MTKEIYKQLNKDEKNSVIFISDCFPNDSTICDDKKMVINWKTVNKVFEKHGIPKSDLYLLDEQIKDAILSAKSITRKDSIVVFIKQWDTNGRPIMLSIALNRNEKNFKVHKITSIYGRNNADSFIKKLYEENKILFFNKEGGQWLEAIGIKLPKEMSSFNHINDKNHDLSIAVFIIEKN